METMNTSTMGLNRKAISIPDVFWAEIAPCEHLVQIYDEAGAFLDALEGFVRGGIDGGEAVIVIATPSHRRTLNARLKAEGVNIELAAATGQYLSLDADEILSYF